MEALPAARGRISEFLLDALRHRPYTLPRLLLSGSLDAAVDDDLQLALYLCYELHYGGLPGVHERWEWEPSLLALRADLERRFEAALIEAVPLDPDPFPGDGVDVVLGAIADAEGPSLPTFVERWATAEQVREFLIHRSAYELKHADPRSWAIPRLSGPTKAALVEIQADEYGGGRPDWTHAELFARSMRAVGLDDTYGAYLDVIPGATLATVNQMSLFGLHRRWRGAIVGHLAMFELTSSIPNRRYGDGLRRLGWDGEATLFFDEHVGADAVRENIAAVDLAAGLARQEPALRGSIVWGALTLTELGERWASYVLESWAEGHGSLLSDVESRSLPEARNPISL